MPTSNDPMTAVEWRCDKCRCIPWDFQVWPQHHGGRIEVQHHETFAGLEESAAAGCSLCRVFWSVMVYKHVDTGTLKNSPCRVTLAFSDNVKGNRYVEFRAGSYHVWIMWRRASLQGTSLEGKDTFPPAYAPKRLAPETLDQDLKSLVRDTIRPWITNCLGASGVHKNCTDHGPKSNAEKNFYLPTRLLDVGTHGSPSVRVVITEQDCSKTTKPVYLILSYCWGLANERAKTTRANLGERRRGIDLDSLPKTVKDAIILTRLMGIRYLWVDALCIVQSWAGDRYIDDWNSEAPKMGLYYSNAYCLISALEASDSSNGIFFERKVAKYATKDCVLAFDTTKDEYIYLLAVRPENELKLELAGMPLMKRGWTFQERLLSPRALLWSKRGLLWHCAGLRFATECSPEAEQPKGSLALQLYSHAIFQPQAGTVMTERWPDAVSEYSGKNLTYETDRLVAIQGLGDRIAAQHNDEYFAGVFRSHLAYGLLWESPTDANRQKLAHFPTWSWASCSADSAIDLPRIRHSFIRCTRPNVFPGAKERSFTTLSGRTVQFEAPMLSMDFGQASAGNWTTSLELNCKLRARFDTNHLAPQPLGKLSVLVLGGYCTHNVYGIIVRPKGVMYERVGLVRIEYPSVEGDDDDEACADLNELEVQYSKSRVEVDLV
ncbi:Fc.00g083840.m01.CDS01 [Cosmosporella sp. VM-42]